MQNKKSVKNKFDYFERYAWLGPLLLLLSIAGIYGQTLQFEFTNWDDDEYVTGNALIQNLNAGNLRLMFSEFYYLMYIPLTLLTYAIEYSAVGNQAWLFHLSNVLLHTSSCFLLYLWSKKYVKETHWAWMVALLFALHPLRVESIAWVSERKDVLYTFFLMCTLLTWQKWKTRPTFLTYGMAVIFMILSGLSKATAVLILPYLILIDYLDNAAFNKRLIIEKIPFLIIALVFGWLQLKGIEGAVESQKDITGYSSVEHLLILGYSYIFYFWKTLIPFPLSAYYPLPDKESMGLHWGYYISPVLIGFILYFVFNAFRKNQRVLVFGWAWFSIGVFLFLKLRPGGFFIAGDRYTYSAAIGLSLAAVMLIRTVSISWFSNIITRYKTALFLCLIYGLMSWHQTKIWRNSITLFQDLTNKSPEFYMAYVNLGTAYEQKQKYTEALESYNKALALFPAYDQAWYNTGNVYLALNRPQEAIEPFKRAVAVNPDFIKAWNNLGSAWFKMNAFDSAIVYYRHTLKISPGYPSALGNLGQALLRNQEYEEAYATLNLAVKQQENEGILKLQLGEAAERLDKDDEAESLYLVLLQTHPEIKETYMALGGLYAKSGRVQAALDICDVCIQKFPDFAPAYFNKGVILYQQGDLQAAQTYFRAAADRGHTQARQLLAGGSTQ